MIIEDVEKYIEIEKNIAKIDNKDSHLYSFDADTDKINKLKSLYGKIDNYFNNINNVLFKIVQLYNDEGLTFDGKFIRLNGKLPVAPMQLSENQIFEMADVCAEGINNCINSAVKGNFGNIQIKQLFNYHYTLVNIKDRVVNLINDIQLRINDERLDLEAKNRVLREKLVKEKDALNERIKRQVKSINENDVEELPQRENKLFLGYENVSMSSEVKEMLLQYGCKIDNINKQPIYLGLDDNETNVAFFENINNKTFASFVKAIYYKNATNFSSVLKIARLCSKEKGVSQNLFNRMSSTFFLDSEKQVSLSNVVIKEEKDNSMDESILENLNELKDYDFDHIEEYNKENSLSKKDFTLVFVDDYPYCFDTNEKVNDFLLLVNDSARYGFFFIINGEFENLTYVKKHSENNYSKNISLAFSQDCDYVRTFDYSDDKYSFISIDDSEIDKCKVDIFKSNKNKVSFSFYDNIKYLPQGFCDINVPYKFNNIASGISIPVGFTDSGEIYNFTTNTSNNPFAMLTGTTGCGKTAFLHTLILCGALKYSPSELQFYIVDFKSKDGSADFEQYKYKKNEKNLYMPHIKYLSVKSTQESAFDVLNMIESCANENLSIIRRNGFSNFELYNKSPKVMSGEMPKVPQKYFIIDEYGTMLLGGVDNTQSSDKNKINEKLYKLLMRIRSSGVGVIFSGQNTTSMEDKSFNLIKSQIVYDPGNSGKDAIKSALSIPNLPLSELNKYYDFVYNKQGYAIAKNTESVKCVHIMYMGETCSKQQLEIADIIRTRCANDYSTKQIVPGFDALENVDSFLTENVATEDGRKVILADDDGTGKIVVGHEDGLKLSLYLGITGSTSIPVPIKFYHEKPNCKVLAKNDKLTKICSNVIMSILYETRNNTSAYKDINYLAIPVGNDRNYKLQMVKEINSYKKHSFVDKRVNVIDNIPQAIQKIMELGDLLLARKNAKSGVDTDTPYYLVINKIDSLLDEQIIENLVIDVPVKNETFDDDEDIDIDESALLGLVPDAGTLDVINNAEIKTKKETYRIEQIKSALSSLLSDGVTYNIYVVLCSAKVEKFKLISQSIYVDFFDTQNLIVGSYEIKKTGNVNEKESNNTCYICDENSLIRLYNFDESVAKEWWENMDTISSKKEK